MILSTTGEKKLVDQRLEEEAGQLADLRLEVSRLNTLLADREIEVKFFHRLSFFINIIFSLTILFHQLCSLTERSRWNLFIDYTFSSTLFFHWLHFSSLILFHWQYLFIDYIFSLTKIFYRLYCNFSSIVIVCFSIDCPFSLPIIFLLRRLFLT